MMHREALEQELACQAVKAQGRNQGGNSGASGTPGKHSGWCNEACIGCASKGLLTLRAMSHCCPLLLT